MKASDDAVSLDGASKTGEPQICNGLSENSGITGPAITGRSSRVARRTTPRIKSVTEIRSLARTYTRTAVNVLVGVMRSKDATATARVSAANAILDRGWGKAAQPLENGSEGALELIHRIERIIVHPENSDS